MLVMGKDIDYLGKLQDYYATHKVMPSYQAIADLLGFKSKNAVAALVARLKLLGFIESAPDKRLKPGRRFFERVLAESTVQAGLPTAALNDNSDSLSIDEYLIENPSRTVLITVKGDSMMGAGICDGDKVVVDKALKPKHKDIVVAVVDDEYTIKRLYQLRGKTELQPENPNYQAITFNENSELQIWGVVVGVVRKYSHASSRNGRSA